MERITIKFSGYLNSRPEWFKPRLVVILDLNEKGKEYSFEFYQRFINPYESPEYPTFEECLPEAIMNLFTVQASKQIFSKDTIPNESGMDILDGYTYEISITIGSIEKLYRSNDVEIKTYPLLYNLSNWYKKQLW